MKKIIKFLKNTLVFILGIIQLIYLIPIIPIAMLKTWLLDNWKISKEKIKFYWNGAKLAVNNAMNNDNTMIFEYKHIKGLKSEDKIEFYHTAIL